MDELEVFRLIAPEFEQVMRSDITQYIELCRPLVSKKQFGKLYTQAVCCLAAHRMKLAGLGRDDTGSLSETFRLSSYSEGGVSVSFGSTPGQSTDGEYALTIYGQQYLSIRRSVIIPIHCSGERGSG